jgi:LacI family transcriptional regulator
MAQKIRIKDIAEMAGVSPGTVDRVLHGRGNVAPLKREAVERVLSEMNYRPNIHLSAISLKKRYSIVITLPTFVAGEYWEFMYRGITRAVEEYSGLDIECELLFYDQFDLFSCREAFAQLMTLSPDGVIVGPTYRNETVTLTQWLEEQTIPYVYIDSMIEDTHPIAFFSSDQFKCGYLISRLLHTIIPHDGEVVLFQAVRIGGAGANTTQMRKAGFMAYINEHGMGERLHTLPFSVVEPCKNRELIGDFFSRNPRVRGAIVLNSRGHIIADYLREQGIEGVKLICIDLTESNIRALRGDEVEFLVGQRPEQQGFLAVKALIQYLVYRRNMKVENYLPLDIIMKENLDFYSEFSDTEDFTT